MTRTHQWFLPCLIALLIAATVSMPGGASMSAQTEATPEAEAKDKPMAAPSFLIEPVDHEGTYFTLELKPGQSKTLKVALGNAGEADSPARTYASDVYTLVNGGFGINPEDAPVTGTTKWLDYEAETLDIPPGRMLEREFTVKVPKKTKPGQYITGLVIQTAEPVAVGDSEMLRQNIVKAIAVFITVPGEVEPKLALGEASLKQVPGSNSLVVEVDNAGNVLLKPEGTITMTNEDGETVLTAPIEMGSIYAGMSTIIELPIPTLLAPGDYLVAVSLDDPETKVKAKAEDLVVTSLDLAVLVTPPAAPIGIDVLTAEPVLDPETDDLQVVNIAVSLTNVGAPLSGARLTLRVERDGELVEDFPLNSSLVVPSGTTEIQQRYVPIGAWESGEYSFSATLEATDLTSGQVTLLDTVQASAPITVQ